MVELSFRCYLCLSLLAIGLNVLIQPEAFCAAADARGSIFSTPDTSVAPTFTGRVQANLPASAAVESFPDPPDREALLAIPSITSDQRNKINGLFQAEGSENRTLQGQLDSLNRILNERKSALAVQFGDNDSIQANIDSVKQQMKSNRFALWQDCQALLNEDQLYQLQSMQHGQLFIASNGTTNVPEPLPPAKPPQPAARPPAPFPGYRPAYPPNGYANIYSPKTMLLNTTKQLLNRALWRL